MKNQLLAICWLTIFMSLFAVDIEAIDCYSCSGTIGEEGGCGQDPFVGPGVTTPDVETVTGASVCAVSPSFFSNFYHCYFNKISKHSKQIAIYDKTISRFSADPLSLIDCTTIGLWIYAGLSCCITNLCSSACFTTPTTMVFIIPFAIVAKII